MVVDCCSMECSFKGIFAVIKFSHPYVSISLHVAKPYIVYLGQFFVLGCVVKTPFSFSNRAISKIAAAHPTVKKLIR